MYEKRIEKYRLILSFKISWSFSKSMEVNKVIVKVYRKERIIVVYIICMLDTLILIRRVAE